jgi:hypothetical protein
MSTYYYMGCDEHKERTKVIAVDRRSGAHIDNPGDLLNFMMKHRDCCLRFFSEYDETRYEYEPTPEAP